MTLQLHEVGNKSQSLATAREGGTSDWINLVTLSPRKAFTSLGHGFVIWSLAVHAPDSDRNSAYIYKL